MCIGINNLADALLDASIHPIWIKDTEGDYLQVNHAFLSTFHLDIVNIISKNSKEIWENQNFSPDYKDKLTLSTRQKQTCEFEFTIENVTHHFSVVSSPYNIDGVLAGVVSVATDISYLSGQNSAVLHSLNENLPYGIIITDCNDIIIEVDEIIMDFFSLTDSIIGKEYTVNPSAVHILKSCSTDTGPQVEYETDVFGEKKHFTVTTIPIYKHSGARNGAIHFFTNFNQNTTAFAYDFYKRISSAMASSYLHIFEFDFDSRKSRELYNCNLPEKRLFSHDGLSEDIYKNLYAIRNMIAPCDQERFDLFFSQSHLHHSFEASRTFNMSLDLRTNPGSRIGSTYDWINLSLSRVNDPKHDSLYLCCIQDVTALKKAALDPLSTLLNREAFFHFLELSEVPNAPEIHAFIIIDIEHFKQFNTNTGLKLGDTVITMLGDIIQSEFRKEDLCARLGSDEFGIYMKNVTDISIIKKRVSSILQKIQDESAKRLNGYVVTIRMGIAYGNVPPLQGENLYPAAEKALDEAKRQMNCPYIIKKCI